MAGFFFFYKTFSIPPDLNTFIVKLILVKYLQCFVRIWTLFLIGFFYFYLQDFKYVCVRRTMCTRTMYVCIREWPFFFCICVSVYLMFMRALVCVRGPLYVSVQCRGNALSVRRERKQRSRPVQVVVLTARLSRLRLGYSRIYSRRGRRRIRCVRFMSFLLCLIILKYYRSHWSQ